MNVSEELPSKREGGNEKDPYAQWQCCEQRNKSTWKISAVHSLSDCYEIH